MPPGTIIYDRDRGNILRDLTDAGEEVVVGQGGRGGRGNKALRHRHQPRAARIRSPARPARNAGSSSN